MTLPRAKTVEFCCAECSTSCDYCGERDWQCEAFIKSADWNACEGCYLQNADPEEADRYRANKAWLEQEL